MQQPAPVTVRARGPFRIFLWALTLLALAFAIGLLSRALAFIPLIREEPSLLTLFLPVLLLFVLSLWLGRWALFHSTAVVSLDSEGLSMRSAVASDSIQWDQIEALRLQMTSGSEAQFAGKGHRVTVPSGSALAPEVNQQVQDWITYRLNSRDLEFGDIHFWGP